MSFSSRMSSSFGAEKKVSKLVQLLLQVQYDYTAIVANLQKEDPAQIGVRKHVKQLIKTIQSDVHTLLKVQEDWEGSVNLTDLEAPKEVEFDSVLEILQVVLKKEKKINKKLVELHSRLVQSVDETRVAEEEIEEMVQSRDQVIQQIVEHIIHLEQNEGIVGEYTVSRMMQEEHLRLKQEDLEEKQVKHRSLLPSTPEQQRKLLSSSSRSSPFSKRIILSPKRRQLQHQAPRCSEKPLKMKKF